jgi:hypothetical protein
MRQFYKTKVCHHKPETLNQGWVGGLFSLSVNSYQRYTHLVSHKASSPAPPLQENISKQESGLHCFKYPGSKMSDFRGGTLFIYLLSVVLGIESRVLHMLDKHSTTELQLHKLPRLTST